MSSGTAIVLRLARGTLYCLTVYRIPIYRANMTTRIERRPSLESPGAPLSSPHRLALWTLTLSACALGAILFLLLVVGSSAGAAGGCGGG
jgi:hypothetical protein